MHWAFRLFRSIVTLQGRTLGFEFAAALVLGRELDEQTRDELSQHYANVIKAFFTIPVSCHLPMESIFIERTAKFVAYNAYGNQIKGVRKSSTKSQTCNLKDRVDLIS